MEQWLEHERNIKPVDRLLDIQVDNWLVYINKIRTWVGNREIDYQMVWRHSEYVDLHKMEKEPWWEIELHLKKKLEMDLEKKNWQELWEAEEKWVLKWQKKKMKKEIKKKLTAERISRTEADEEGEEGDDKKKSSKKPKLVDVKASTK